MDPQAKTEVHLNCLTQDAALNRKHSVIANNAMFLFKLILTGEYSEKKRKQLLQEEKRELRQVFKF